MSNKASNNGDSDHDKCIAIPLSGTNTQVTNIVFLGLIKFGRYNNFYTNCFEQYKYTCKGKLYYIIKLLEYIEKFA